MFKPNTATKYKPIKIVPESEEQWKSERKKGIGGSDVGAICGLNKYKTGYDVWLEKTGRKENNVDNVFARSGKYVETAIASLAEDDHENIVINKSSIPDIIYANPNKPYQRITPDRIYWNLAYENDNQGYLECKNTLADIDPEDIPYWEAQLLYGMFILGVEEGIIAWLERGAFPYYRYYSFENKETYNYAIGLAEEVDHFWNEHVLKDIPPEPKTGMESEQLYPQQNDKEEVAASDEIKEKAARLKEVKEEKKKIEKEEKKLKSDVKAFMKSAEAIVDDAGNKLATWKKVKGSQKLDQDALAEEKPEIFNQYLKQTKGYRRMMVK